MPMRLSVAVGLVSGAIIAFQLSLMQILSIVQWHHFATLIIALALLGFGASGTCIALLREQCIRRYTHILPLGLLACGLAMSLTVAVAQHPFVRFDSLLLFAEPRSFWRLLLTCLIYFIPFFLGALTIGLAFTRNVPAIGQLYCANLIGSGLGGILAIILMWRFPPESIPALIAVLPILAGIIMCEKHTWAAALVLIPVTWFIWHPPGLIMSEFKALKKALDLPGSTIVSTQNSPFGLMQVLASPSLRFAPGVSLRYHARLPVTRAAFQNGDWFGPILPWQAHTRETLLDYTTNALPYVLAEHKLVLVLDAGTGTDVGQALSHGASVIAVEPNPIAVDIMQSIFGREARVRMFNCSSRTYLMRDTSPGDLILLPMIDAFGGTSGLYALAENYLLTVEAVTQMWNRLTPQGMLSLSCWLDYPPRTSLKLLATLAEVIRNRGLEPKTHMMAVRSWGTMTVTAQRMPISQAEASRVNMFCDRLGFDPVILPGLEPARRVRFHALQDTRWFDTVDMLLSSPRRPVPYDFNIKPATDDRPYFSQFLTHRSLARLKALYGLRSIPFFEISYLLLILTAMLISLLALLLIILPLIKAGRTGKLRTLLYFGGIGIGYLFIEIVLIQRFILYLGNPIYAAATVIGAMLFFSGCGSLVSSRCHDLRRFILGGIPCLVLLLVFLLPPILSFTIHLSPASRVVITLLLIAPPAFGMGMPFPLGIAAIAPDDVAWAWGINGCLSVASALLATIIAVELGFTWVMLLAAAAYSVPYLVLHSKDILDNPFFLR